MVTDLIERMYANRYTRASLANLRRKRATGLIICRNAAIRLLLNNARDTDRNATLHEREIAANAIFAEFLAETE